MSLIFHNGSSEYTYSYPYAMINYYCASGAADVSYPSDNNSLSLSGFASYTQPGNAMGGVADSSSSLYNFIKTNIPIEDFYAQIQNAAARNMHVASTTGSAALKTLPADWIIHVVSTTDISNNSIVDGSGNTWFKVVDPTDAVSGWMIASSTATRYISSYDSSVQAALEASSSDQITIGTSTSETGDYVLDAIDHYYNNSSTPNSLYNSNDQSGTNGQNDISILKQRSFPEKVVLAIAATENGGRINGLPLNFNNENVSFDYGHGEMQVTFSPGGGWDKRGIGSGITIPPCGLPSSSYTNCYSNTSSTTGLKYYQPDTSVTGNPTFKQYSNTPQSIYANIKDGMQVLASGYRTDASPLNRVCDNYPDPVSIYPPQVDATTTYSCTDEEIVDVTAGYNGTSSYLSSVADSLTNINHFFPSVTSSDASTTDITNKLSIASDHDIFMELHSPGDLSIQDTHDHIIGVVNGVATDTFPFATYDPQTKTAHIFFPQDDNLTYKVTGTGSGVYGLDIVVTSGSRRIAFHRDETVPINPGEVHTYTIDADAIAHGVTLTIDRKGNGTINETDHLGAALTKIVPPTVLPLPSNPFIPVVPRSLSAPKGVMLPVRIIPKFTSAPVFGPSTMELEVASSTVTTSSKQN